ncbi:MAG TPA: aldehyde dehydrogenase family protein, partial [Solirubrobacter sp.]|nr:aldehyde dehydrogenase family protein [Solirubrobacter sp.]
MTTPLHCRTFIDNEFRTGAETFDRRNPATGDVVAIADRADAETVDAAVSAARRAFGSWGKTSVFERGALLRELARTALDRLEDLATSMTLEMGKPLDEARGEVRKFAQAMRYYAEEAERIGGETIPNESTDYLSVVRKEPIGPVAAITPWNYPVELIGWKLGGALGAGCTMVVKPSEYTPGAAHILAECIRDAGFPPGVVNVVHGGGEVGALLAGHPRIAKIAFTGSNATGQELFRTVSGITQLTMELGGSCP